MCRCMETIPSYSNTQVRNVLLILQTPCFYICMHSIPCFLALYFSLVQQFQESVTPHLNVSSLVKIQQTELSKYQTILGSTNSVAYLLNICIEVRLKKNGLYLIGNFSIQCLLLCFRVYFLNQISTQAVFFSLSLSSGVQCSNSLIYGQTCWSVYFATASSDLPSSQPSCFS